MANFVASYSNRYHLQGIPGEDGATWCYHVWPNMVNIEKTTCHCYQEISFHVCFACISFGFCTSFAGFHHSSGILLIGLDQEAEPVKGETLDFYHWMAGQKP
jgi:hypothetical protein